jgi:hypothetical protein
MFGDALIRAVELEGKFSSYPRIMLTREVTDEAHALMRSSMTDDFIENYILQAEDGLFFLNVLVGLKSYLGSDDAELRAIYIERYNMIAARLQQQLDASADNAAHFRKHLWFAKYWNGAVGTHRCEVKRLRGPGTIGIAWTNSLCGTYGYAVAPRREPCDT